MPAKHKTAPMQTRSGIVRVDAAIFPLITLLNSIPGIETRNCCQGDMGPGYVQFQDSNEQAKGASVRFLQKMIALLDVVADRQTRLENEFFENHGPRNGTKSLQLSFTIELGHHFTIRWSSDSYKFVLEAAQAIALDS